MNPKNILLMVIAACFLISTWALAQEPVIKLQHDAFANRKRLGVVFSHGKHMEKIECTECHHFYKDGKNVWDETRESNCAACHKPTEQGRTMGLMKAMHENCVGCHSKMRNAPVMCGECHKK